MHIDICICMYTHIYICIYIYEHKCINWQIHRILCISAHICIYTYMFIQGSYILVQRRKMFWAPTLAGTSQPGLSHDTCSLHEPWSKHAVKGVYRHTRLYIRRFASWLTRACSEGCVSHSMDFWSLVSAGPGSRSS